MGTRRKERVPNFMCRVVHHYMIVTLDEHS